MKTKRKFQVFLIMLVGSCSYGQTNQFSGTDSGASITTGYNNTGYGPYTLNALTGNANNTAIGYEVLKNATSGANTGVGSQALTATTSGSSNSAFGSLSLLVNSTGQSNVGVGASALVSNTTGSDNTSVGKESLNKNTSGISNTAIGSRALFYNDGDGNTCVGKEALSQWPSVQSNSYNIGLGHQAGYLGVGNNNIFIGNRAGISCVGSGNVIIGRPGSGLNISNTIILATETSGTTPGSEFVRINSVGMGIGTVDPTKKLDVNGEVRIRSLSTSSTNSYFLSVDSNGNVAKQLGTSSSGTNIYNTSAAISGSGDRTVSLAGHNLIFYTSGGGDGKIYIGADANNPGLTPINGLDDDYNLLVEKGILTEKVKVALRSTANWADYVFSKDYDLKPLSEVEAFINKNGHLPGVRSAEELKKEGLDLAEMQAKQMEKIEELTLYLIEQEKKIDAQSQLIERQCKQIEDLIKLTR